MGSQPKDYVLVDLALVRQLAPMAERLGISLPGLVRMAPVIDLSMPIRALAMELGMLLARRNICIKSGKIVTVEEDGEVRRMTARRFPDWTEQFCLYINAMGPRNSLSVDDAEQILATDTFRGCLRHFDPALGLPVE